LRVARRTPAQQPTHSSPESHRSRIPRSWGGTANTPAVLEAITIAGYNETMADNPFRWLRDSTVIAASAFFDSVEFNELWARGAP
jgi:hypothetical protein